MEKITKYTRNGRTFHKVQLNTGKGLTEQGHKKECDMNYILRNYHKNGIIRHAKTYQGTYDDITIQDFQAAQLLVKGAEKMFNDLPANLRNKFDNDPGKFYEFTNNPANKDEMIKLGMIRGNDGLKADATPSGAPTKEAETPPPTPPA